MNQEIALQKRGWTTVPMWNVFVSVFTHTEKNLFKMFFSIFYYFYFSLKMLAIALGFSARKKPHPVVRDN